jgi:hypothetical protein
LVYLSTQEHSGGAHSRNFEQSFQLTNAIERCEVVPELALRIIRSQLSLPTHKVVALIIGPDAGKRIFTADVFLQQADPASGHFPPAAE